MGQARARMQVTSIELDTSWGCQAGRVRGQVLRPTCQSCQQDWSGLQHPSTALSNRAAASSLRPIMPETTLKKE